jgi:hypothetical protein
VAIGLIDSTFSATSSGKRRCGACASDASRVEPSVDFRRRRQNDRHGVPGGHEPRQHCHPSLETRTTRARPRWRHSWGLAHRTLASRGPRGEDGPILRAANGTMRSSSTGFDVRAHRGRPSRRLFLAAEGNDRSRNGGVTIPSVVSGGLMMVVAGRMLWGLRHAYSSQPVVENGCWL